MDWLRVHVRLLRGRVLTPHVDGAGHLADGQVKLASCHYLADTTFGPVQELDQPGDKLIAGLRVAKAAVSAEAPRKGPVTVIDDHSVVVAAADFLHVDRRDRCHRLRTCVLLDEQADAIGLVHPMKGLLARLFNVLALGVVTALAVFGVAPHPDVAVDIDHAAELSSTRNPDGWGTIVGHHYGLLVHRVVFDAALSKSVVSTGKYLSLVCQEERVIAAGRSGDNAVSVESGNQSGNFAVLEIIQTKLAFLVAAPSVNLAFGRDGELVNGGRPRRYILDLYVRQSGESDRLPDGVRGPGELVGFTADIVPIGGTGEEQDSRG